MLGYFHFKFTGKKTDITELLTFIDDKSKTSSHATMYKEILQKYVTFPAGYTNLSDNQLTSISLATTPTQATDLSWFYEEEFVEAVKNAVPSLKMTGLYKLDDASIEKSYSSHKQITSEHTQNITPIRVEVEISISCQLGLDLVLNNVEYTLYSIIKSNSNSIIKQLHLAYDENDSIILCHEGFPASKKDEDYKHFAADMKLFCCEIAKTHPELEISGQFAIEKQNSPSSRGIYIYIQSEAGSNVCYAHELSEESDPGIIFDDSSSTRLYTYDIDADYDDDN